MAIGCLIVAVTFFSHEPLFSVFCRETDFAYPINGIFQIFNAIMFYIERVPVPQIPPVLLKPNEEFRMALVPGNEYLIGPFPECAIKFGKQLLGKVSIGDGNKIYIEYLGEKFTNSFNIVDAHRRMFCIRFQHDSYELIPGEQLHLCRHGAAICCYAFYETNENGERIVPDELPHISPDRLVVYFQTVRGRKAYADYRLEILDTQLRSGSIKKKDYDKRSAAITKMLNDGRKFIVGYQPLKGTATCFRCKNPIPSKCFRVGERQIKFHKEHIVERGTHMVYWHKECFKLELVDNPLTSLDKASSSDSTTIRPKKRPKTNVPIAEVTETVCSTFQGYDKLQPTEQVFLQSLM